MSFRSFWQKAVQNLRERPYRAVALVGLVVMAVLFGRDVLSSLAVRADIARLKKARRALEAQIAADSVLVERLGDPDFLERYARENFLMRREGDEVFIIVEN